MFLKESSILYEEANPGEGGEGQGNRPPAQKSEPVKSQKVASRNQRVSVQYSDGTVKKDVKYKVVESDIKDNKCVIIDS